MSLKFITLPLATRGYHNVGTGEGGVVEVLVVRELKGKIIKKIIKGSLSLKQKLSGKITKKIIKGVVKK